MDIDTNFWDSIVCIKDFVLIKARKEIIKALEESHLRCVVDKNKILFKDPLINKVHTFYKNFPNGFPLDKLNSLQFTIPNNLYRECYKEFITIESVFSAYRFHCYNNGVIDSYIDYLCKQIKKYAESWNEAIAITESHRDKVLAAAVVMKNKYYRINRDAYDKVKNNLLIKTLCKKS